MKANRMLPAPLLNRYNQAMEKSQLSIVCSKRYSVYFKKTERPVGS